MSDVVENVEHSLTAKLGPLPAWAWGLILAGLALVAYFVYARGSAGVSAVTNKATTTTVDSAAGEGLPASTGTSTDTTTSTSSSSILSSNQAWIARATVQVALDFAASPGAVYAALYKGVSGQDLTATEGKYWDRAISDLGVPPEGTQGNSNVIPDAVATTPVQTSNSSAPATSAGSAADASGTTTVSQGPTITGYIRERGTYNVYAQYSDGSHGPKLSTAQWIAAGAPNAQEVNPFSGTTTFDLPLRYLRQRLTYDLYAQYEDGRVEAISDSQWRAAGSPNAEETNMFAGQEKKWM